MLKDELVKTLCDFIRTRSVTGEEQALSDCILRKLRDAGLSPEQDADGNVVCFVGEGEKTLVVNGHLDTVPPAEGWETDPFEPVIDEDRVIGLGSSDMVALAKTVTPKLSPGHFWQASRASAVGRSPSKARRGAETSGACRLGFAFTVNEEGGSVSARNGARTVTDRYDFDYALTCEPTYDEETGRLRLGIGCQGRTIAHVTVGGRACHSAAFDQGVNAIYQALPVVQRVSEKAKTIQPIDVAPGIAVKPSLSVTVIRAGEAENVIPAACRLTIDRRLAPGEDFDTFARELLRFTEGVDCTVEQARGSLPVVAKMDGALVTLGERVLRERFGQVDYYFNRGRVDLSYFREKATEILNMGPGLINKPHKANEYASVKGMLAAYDVLKELLESYEG